MKPNKICPALVVLALSSIVLLGIPAVAADEAAPQLPQGFYGMVEAGGSPVGPGLIVEAVGPGVISKMDGNPVKTLSDGSYGALNFTSQKLIVQGDVAAGTSITFYVGAIQAEVYDVAAGGPWNTTYSFQPGEVTELNLRVASLPAQGQTREPTPVQTVVASSTPAVSSTIAAPITTAYGGPLLPQVPDSSGQPPTADVTQQSSGSSAGPGQSGTTGQESGEHSASQQPVGQENQTAAPVTLPPSGNMTLYVAAVILLLLVIGGGAYFYTQHKKSDTESKEGTGKKEE